MKKVKLISSIVVTFVILLFVPLITGAQGPMGPFLPGLANGDVTGGELGDFLQTTIGVVNTVIIPFIIGIGFLFFVFGMFRYFIAGGANEDMKASGKSLMIYATLGFVLIIVLWGIVNLIATSTGLNDPLTTTLIPKAPGG